MNRASASPGPKRRPRACPHAARRWTAETNGAFRRRRRARAGRLFRYRPQREEERVERNEGRGGDVERAAPEAPPPLGGPERTVDPVEELDAEPDAPERRLVEVLHHGVRSRGRSAGPRGASARGGRGRTRGAAAARRRTRGARPSGSSRCARGGAGCPRRRGAARRGRSSGARDVGLPGSRVRADDAPPRARARRDPGRPRGPRRPSRDGRGCAPRERRRPGRGPRPRRGPGMPKYVVPGGNLRTRTAGFSDPRTGSAPSGPRSTRRTSRRPPSP